jgi:enoyl-CoA hydratase/carnithine racemase
MTDALLTHDLDGVRVLTLNRPEARNSLSRELNTALTSALVAADEDTTVRAIVITGTDPAFCAGLDLKALAAEGSAYIEAFHEDSCFARVGELRTPVIGAVNGAAFTGGLELALGCDFLVAGERAIFADTHARVGVLPGGGLTARLPDRVGTAWARRMSFTSEVVDAALALRIGLVTEVVPHDDLMSRALGVAAGIADGDGATLQLLKGMYEAGWRATTGQVLAIETELAGANTPTWGDLESNRRQVLERNRAQLA